MRCRIALVVGALLGCLVADTASAVPVATLHVNPQHVKAGDPVTLSGRYYNARAPIVLRWNDVEGEVLATVPPAPDPDPRRGVLDAAVTVPNAAPGPYLIVATQQAVDGLLTWGVPARVRVEVVGPAGAPLVGAASAVPEAGLLDRMATEGSRRAWQMGLAAALAAVVALAVTGVALAIARRHPQAAPAGSVARRASSR